MTLNAGFERGMLAAGMAMRWARLLRPIIICLMLSGRLMFARRDAVSIRCFVDMRIYRRAPMVRAMAADDGIYRTPPRPAARLLSGETIITPRASPRHDGRQGSRRAWSQEFTLPDGPPCRAPFLYHHAACHAMTFPPLYYCSPGHNTV